MAFKFRLQSVLDHRIHLEEVAQHHLAARLNLLRECQDHLNFLEEELKRAQAELLKKDINGISAGEFVLANEYSTVLRLQALAQKARLPMLQADVDEARNKVILATQDRKALDILKEKHKNHFMREELLQEQRTLDEVAVGMFARRED